MNYVLDLNRSYNELFDNFRTSYKQLLKKADSSSFLVEKNIPLEDILTLTRKKLRAVSKTTETDYNNFLQLYNILKSRGQATNYCIYSKENKIIASAVFLFSHKRAYYILAGNNTHGTSGASHLVIDAFIKDHAGKDLLLDFEGSDIESIAFFFKGFGAQEEKHAGLHYNNLPWLFRLFKK
jgi:hypothetical protein